MRRVCNFCWHSPVASPVANPRTVWGSHIYNDVVIISPSLCLRLCGDHSCAASWNMCYSFPWYCFKKEQKLSSLALKINLYSCFCTEICCLEYIGEDITFFSSHKSPNSVEVLIKNEFWVCIHLHVHLLKSVLPILNRNGKILVSLEWLKWWEFCGLFI